MTPADLGKGDSRGEKVGFVHLSAPHFLLMFGDASQAMTDTTRWQWV